MRRKIQPKIEGVPRFFLKVNHVEINSNGTPYLWYDVKKWRNGVPLIVGRAVVNLSEDFREIGFKGTFTLDLFEDKMLRYKTK